MLTTPHSWYEAKSKCEQEGGHLTEIETQEEQTTLSQAAAAWNGKFYAFWIGLTDLAQEGTWIWDHSSKEADPTFWVPGEPNNYGGYQHCAQLYPGSVWDDNDCNKSDYNKLPLGAICEKQSETTSTSEPINSNATKKPTTVTPVCLIEEDTDYYGNDIAGPKRMEDTDECMLWCASVSECTHWVYQGEARQVGERHCWLKNSNSGKRMLDGYISGNRECSGKING